MSISKRVHFLGIPGREFFKFEMGKVVKNLLLWMVGFEPTTQNIGGPADDAIYQGNRGVWPLAKMSTKCLPKLRLVTFICMPRPWVCASVHAFNMLNSISLLLGNILVCIPPMRSFECVHRVPFNLLDTSLLGGEYRALPHQVRSRRK